jgi:hypothetical protein
MPITYCEGIKRPCNSTGTQFLGFTREREMGDDDNLSRRLQPGYNYVGQTNNRQPLHISAVGRLRDYLPTADCCIGPGRRAPNPLSTLIPAVCCQSRILKHSRPPTLRMAAAQEGRRPTRGGTLLWPIATLLAHLRFRHPSPLRPAAWLLGLSLVPSPSGLEFRLPHDILTRPAARLTS